MERSEFKIIILTGKAKACELHPVRVAEWRKYIIGLTCDKSWKWKWVKFIMNDRVDNCNDSQKNELQWH